LSKCHICGTLYIGPPLGHVRDPDKQKTFVEAELSALLQSAGGTLPVIKKNEKGVYVIVEPAGETHGHAAAVKPAPAAVATKASAPAAQAAGVADKAMAPPTPKAAAEPNRSLNRRSTYAGVVDSGPVAGESKEEKIARLQKVVAGAKQRAEEGGGAHVTVVDSSASADAHRPAAEAQAETGAASAAPLSAAAAGASPVAGAETPDDLAPDEVAAATTPTATTSHAAGQPDRTLMNDRLMQASRIPGQFRARVRKRRLPA
jgi:hypothetical protein